LALDIGLKKRLTDRFWEIEKNKEIATFNNVALSISFKS
jgi:hypothetical protein